MMRLKSVAWVAMVGMAYWCVVSLLFDTGLLEEGCDVIRIGWENEYGESGMVSLDKLKWLLSIPYEICCLFFCTVFVWKLRCLGGRKALADTAFLVWCVALAFSLVDTLSDSYMFLHFKEDTVMPVSSWEETEPVAGFLFFSLRGETWLLLNTIVRIAADLALLVLFVSLAEKRRAMGLTGSVVVLVDAVGCMVQLPFVLCGLGWIALFAVTLRDIQRDEMKEGRTYSAARLLSWSIAVCVLYAVLVLLSGGKGKVSWRDPLETYMGCTTDSALIQKQYEAVMKTVTRRFASDPEALSGLSRPVNATQTFTFDENGKVTICWAFEFREPELGQAPFYHDVLFVIDGAAYYYAYDEMWQERQDEYLRLSAITQNGEWKPATYYVDIAWKCVGYETCNRYGSRKTEVHEWNAILEKAEEMGLKLSVNELPLVKKAGE